MNFTITNIENHHKEQIHKLIEEINQEDKLNYSLTEEWLDYVIENAGQGIFLAFNGDELAGLGTAMVNTAYRDQASLNVVVSPRYRRRGLGHMLYDKIYDFARRQDVKIVEAYVKKRLNVGVSFAERRAFNTALYSWEMELDLDRLEFSFGELPGFNFRLASEKDGFIYKRIIYDAFTDDLGEDALIEVLKDPSIIIYILEKNKQAIGSASIQLRKDLSLAYIYDIAILEDHRGQGMGSYLLGSCIEALKDKDIAKISLLVTGDNKRALDLYRKFGFREVDIDLVMSKRVSR